MAGIYPRQRALQGPLLKLQKEGLQPRLAVRGLKGALAPWSKEAFRPRGLKGALAPWTIKGEAHAETLIRFIQSYIKI